MAQGLHFALEVAVDQQLMEQNDAQRCHALVDSYGFARAPRPDRDALLQYFARDKKMEGGLLHLVLPTGIGSCRTVPGTVASLLRS